jgi:hypothetical protein
MKTDTKGGKEEDDVEDFQKKNFLFGWMER